MSDKAIVKRTEPAPEVKGLRVYFTGSAYVQDAETVRRFLKARAIAACVDEVEITIAEDLLDGKCRIEAIALDRIVEVV